MSFFDILEEKQQKFEAELKTVFSDISASVPERLCSAMEYSLITTGGKRIRPLILLEVYKMFKKAEPCGAAVKFAAAIECIHAYSLIHDDLPCMDNDDFRRGKPTNHKVYGEDMAVLAGDALLNIAYELMFSVIASEENPEPYIRAANMIAKNVGARGLIAGQSEDITAGENVSVDTLKYIIRHKTGDLIICAAAAGAILGGAKEDEIMRILNFADNFALAFQIKDDLLDYGETGEKTCSSFVKFYGVSRSTQSLGDSTHKAHNELTELEKNGLDASFLKQLTVKSASRKK